MKKLEKFFMCLVAIVVCFPAFAANGDCKPKDFVFKITSDVPAKINVVDTGNCKTTFKPSDVAKGDNPTTLTYQTSVEKVQVDIAATSAPLKCQFEFSMRNRDDGVQMLQIQVASPQIGCAVADGGTSIVMDTKSTT